MSKKYSGRIYDPNHAMAEYDLYFNDTLIVAYYRNYADNADIVQGSLNPSSGGNLNSTTRVRTNNYIPFTAGRYKIMTDTDNDFVLYTYNANKEWISEASFVEWMSSGSIIEITNQDVAYVRLAFAKSAGGTITPEEVTGIMIMEV